jgi:hypothetical protein
MTRRRYTADPFPPVAPPTTAQVRAETAPHESLSVAAAEMRIAEILAHIASISRQIEDKNIQRRKSWASDPVAEWRRSAMQARDELRKEEHDLRVFLERQKTILGGTDRTRRAVEDLMRQDGDRATREARRVAKRNGLLPLWDVYLRAEVTLLTIMATGALVGPLGESLLRSAQDMVPEWYRDHWLKTVYGTTWGHHARQLKGDGK